MLLQKVQEDLCLQVLHGQIASAASTPALAALVAGACFQMLHVAMWMRQQNERKAHRCVKAGRALHFQAPPDALQSLPVTGPIPS